MYFLMVFRWEIKNPSVECKFRRLDVEFEKKKCFCISHVYLFLHLGFKTYDEYIFKIFPFQL